MKKITCGQVKLFFVSFFCLVSAYVHAMDRGDGATGSACEPVPPTWILRTDCGHGAGSAYVPGMLPSAAGSGASPALRVASLASMAAQASSSHQKERPQLRITIPPAPQTFEEHEQMSPAPHPCARLMRAPCHVLNHIFKPLKRKQNDEEVPAGESAADGDGQGVTSSTGGFWGCVQNLCEQTVAGCLCAVGAEGFSRKRHKKEDAAGEQPAAAAAASSIVMHHPMPTTPDGTLLAALHTPIADADDSDSDDERSD